MKLNPFQVVVIHKNGRYSIYINFLKGRDKMKDAMIIANPSSGQKQAEDYAQQAKEILEANGRFATINITESGDDVVKFAQEAARETYNTIIILGGDGTVSLLASSLKDEDYRPEIAILPTGTVNNVARALNIEINLDKAIKDLPNLTPQSIDAGLVNDQVFLSLVSTGTIPESVFEVNEEEKERLGPVAYLVEGIQALNKQKSYRFSLNIDNKVDEFELDLLLIGVSSSVVGLTNFFKDASYNDGKLHIFGLKKTTLGDRVGSIANWIFDTEKVQNNGVLTVDAKNIKIELLNKDVSTHVAVDGDKGPSFPVEISVLPNYINVLTPDQK